MSEEDWLLGQHLDNRSMCTDSVHFFLSLPSFKFNFICSFCVTEMVFVSVFLTFYTAHHFYLALVGSVSVATKHIINNSHSKTPEPNKGS